MPLSYSGGYSGSASGGGTSGTLATSGNYTDPVLPRQSQARGIQGTDGRAYTRQVQGDELVANQLGTLMNREGAYLSNARRRGLEQSNSRGMLNSSIAAGAAERAGIEAAMPIAAADAATYGRAQTENMGALNEAQMQQRDIMNQQEMARWNSLTAGQSAGMQAQIAREQMAAELQSQREQLAYQGEQAGLDRYHQLGMSNTEFGQQMGLQSNQYGLQDYYGARQDQRNFGYQVASGMIGQQIQDQSNWFNTFTQSYFTNPDLFSPEDMGTIAGYGQQIAPSYSNWMSFITGFGG